MNVALKKIVKQFIPPIVYKLREAFKKNQPFDFTSPIPVFDNKSKTMIILGNGPSLFKSVEK